MNHGARTLAEPELLAIVLGSGTRTSEGTRTAVSLGRDLLERFGSLRDMAAAEPSDFKAIDGIGEAKAARLVATFEIGRRASRKRTGRRTAFRTPEDVYREYGPALRDLNREIFVVLLLNTSHVRISEFVASEGGLAASVVEPRLVFRRAILEHAAAVICLHNHPSGNPEPSREDIAVTRQLAQAGRVVGVPLRDHLIVAGDTYTSLAERGVLG